jgi:pimeloyl-ACP methyl ester carboxylesterase
VSQRRTQYSMTRGTGRYGLTGEIDVTWEPRIAVSNAPTIILLHGFLGYCDYFLTYQSSYPKLSAIAPLLASYGFRVIAIDGGIRSDSNGPENNATSHWGNPSHTARIETVRTNLGLSTICLVGASMGNYAALQYTVNHPTRVSAIVSYSGLADMVAFYDAQGNPSYISDAWGVTAPNPLPGAADITSHANLVGKRWLAFHDEDDTLIPLSTAQAMTTHIGSTARLVTFPTGEHVGTMQNADIEDAVSWLWDYS